MILYKGRDLTTLDRSELIAATREAIEERDRYHELWDKCGDVGPPLPVRTSGAPYVIAYALCAISGGLVALAGVWAGQFFGG